ncbi:MAG: putative DNA binding domain-containing protein [Eubacterium sp.]|nr:putative DNA binding domain-containing protein [Eubacterium sp.]
MREDDIRRMAHDILDKCAVESDWIEYKKSDEQKDKILKTVCAYSNNYMNREIGLLFIGVEEVNDDNEGIKAIPLRPIYGVPEGKIEPIENGLKSLLAHIHPRPNYRLIQDKIDGKFYIIIAVEPGANGPYETSEKAEKDKKINLKAGRYIRIRRDSRKPNNREEFELLKKFADFHFSSELNETATIDDLSYEYMKEYLVETNAKDDIKSMPKLEMAEAMGLIAKSEYGGYRAKNFAVLMFAEEPQKFIPYARVEVIMENSGTDKMTSKQFNGPIWIQARRVIDYFEELIMSAYTVRESKKAGHRMVYNWPLQMFSELATNCILHKEYSRKEYIGIYVYKDHISFINHNRPVPPVTIEDMNNNTEFRDRVYLNPEIKEMFFALDLIESYGSGIRRAKNAMKDNNSPKLVFEPDNDLDDYTMVTAYINEEFARIRDKEDELQTNRKENRKENHKENHKEKIKLDEIESRIIDRIRIKSNITIKELAIDLKISEQSVRYRLDKLKNQNIIYRIGSTKSGEWVINDYMIEDIDFDN